MLGNRIEVRCWILIRYWYSIFEFELGINRYKLTIDYCFGCNFVISGYEKKSGGYVVKEWIYVICALKCLVENVLWI